MPHVDWTNAHRFRMGAIVSAACSCLLFALAGAYLSAGDAAWGALCLMTSIAFSIRARASAARCAAALAGYSMSPSAALKEWGGTWRILFPPKAVILPPSK